MLLCFVYLRPFKLSVLQRLQAAFRDRTSPVCLEPGTHGPSNPGDGFVVPEQEFQLGSSVQAAGFHSSASQSEPPTLSAEEEGRKKLIEQGYVILHACYHNNTNVHSDTILNRSSNRRWYGEIWIPSGQYSGRALHLLLISLRR